MPNPTLTQLEKILKEVKSQYKCDRDFLPYNIVYDLHLTALTAKLRDYPQYRDEIANFTAYEQLLNRLRDYFIKQELQNVTLLLAVITLLRFGNCSELVAITVPQLALNNIFPINSCILYPNRDNLEDQIHLFIIVGDLQTDAKNVNLSKHTTAYAVDPYLNFCCPASNYLEQPQVKEYLDKCGGQNPSIEISNTVRELSKNTIDNAMNEAAEHGKKFSKDNLEKTRLALMNLFKNADDLPLEKIKREMTKIYVTNLPILYTMMPALASSLSSSLSLASDSPVLSKPNTPQVKPIDALNEFAAKTLDNAKWKSDPKSDKNFFLQHKNEAPLRAIFEGLKTKLAETKIDISFGQSKKTGLWTIVIKNFTSEDAEKIQSVPTFGKH